MARRDTPSTVPLTALQESWFADDFDHDAMRGAHDDAPRRSTRTVRERAFLRLHRTFLGARAAVAIVLLAAELVAREMGSGTPVRTTFATLAICAAYLVLTLAVWALPRFNVPAQSWATRWSQWSMTVGVDLTVFASLHLLSASSGINYVPLFALPVLMAAVLAPVTGAMSVAACVTLLLLGEAAYGVYYLDRGALALTQAGLIGSGFFAVAFLVGQLARRLAREEIVARGSQSLARQQALVSRIVIEAMDDGVLVVNRRLKVRAANPAARRLLGAVPHGDKPLTHLKQRAAWAPLAYIAEMAFEHAATTPGGMEAEERREVTLSLAPNDLRRLLVRSRMTPPSRDPMDAADEVLCVLFVADLRDVESRIRQEKLAAMGRISAGVAHEIRNPLSAIAQANALLSEDAVTDTGRRLTRIVTENVDRLSRIVQDVMAVAPTAAGDEAVAVETSSVVRLIAGEWAQTCGVTIGPSGPLAIEIASRVPPIRFDADHLRRVLVNLLDNARRYSSGRPGCMRLTVHVADPQHVELCVANDGPRVPQDVEPHLFEPFFSTRSRGTGLGLYICRELCERYDARIEYRLQDPAVLHRNEFRVLARRWHGALPGVDLDLSLPEPSDRPSES